MDRLGVGYDALSAVNPRLIFASASLFGPCGPRTRHPGYDTIAQAAGGMVMATRRPGDDLGTPLGGTTDQVGGMMLAYAILAALLHRERTGEGQQAVQRFRPCTRCACCTTGHNSSQGTMV